ncbi:MAG: membrane protein insertase YidC [Myxococcota bacterium]
MDDPKRQMVILALLGVALVGSYLVSDVPPDAAPSDAETQAVEAAPAEAAEPPATAAAGPTESERREVEELFRIETDAFHAELSNLNTGLVKLEPREERFTDGRGAPLNLVTTDKEAYYAFVLAIPGVDMPADAVWEGEQLSARAVRFRWEGDGMRISRRIEAGAGPFQLWSTVRVENLGDRPRPIKVRYSTYHYVSKEAEDAGFIGRPSTALSFGVCLHSESDEEEGEVEREEGSGLAEEAATFRGGVRFTGVVDSYFANAIAAADGRAGECHLEASLRGPSLDDVQGTLLETHLTYDEVTLAPGPPYIERTLGYVGPADRDALRLAGHHLPEVVDLGWFSFLANWLVDLLRWIHGFAGNWGLAIILLTILVKAAFFPLTVRSFQSMAKMRTLKPKLDALNEKYADDPQLKGQAVMGLYKSEGVNPASGCLPMLLQMPVWFALYRSISTNLELYHAPFVGWLQDLSAPDPYFVLPAFVAVLMHLQQRLTPSTMDPAQARLFMYLMPIMIGGFMLFLPAGLCLYMVTNSTLTMIQQRIIYARMDAQEDAATTGEDDAEGDMDPSDETVDAPSDEPGASANPRRRSGSRKASRKKGKRRGRS